MASIRTETVIDASPDDVWAALRDWGALHERLAPGFATNVELEGDDRIVTFFNGSVVRETLVDLDDDARRLAWAMVEGPYSHHNGYAQVFPDGGERARFVWTTDILPNDLAARTAELMQHATSVIKKTLESARARS